MRRMLVAAAVAGVFVWAHPAEAVLKSTSLLVTDLGQAIPGATITLSRPRPRHVLATAKPKLQQQQSSQPLQGNQPAQADQSSPPGPPGQGAPPAGSGPASGSGSGSNQPWLVVKTDRASRVRLRYDDRDAPPGTLVDITVHFVNGETLLRRGVPIEQIVKGGTLEIEPPVTASGASGQPDSGAVQQPGGQPQGVQSPGDQAEGNQPVGTTTTGGPGETGAAQPPDDGPPDDGQPGPDSDGPSEPVDGGGPAGQFGFGTGDSHHHHNH